MPNDEPQYGGLINKEFIFLIITLIIVLSSGFYVLEQVSEQFDIKCNQLYGENNWHLIENGTLGLGIRYQCVRINKSMP